MAFWNGCCQVDLNLRIPWRAAESMSMEIWVAGTLNEIFIRSCYTRSKTPFFVIAPSCTPHSTCINIGF